MTKLLYEKESFAIRGAAFNVYKQLGCGHKEVVYQRAYLDALIAKQLSVEKEKRLPVYFNGKVVGVYVPDFVINGGIIVELKAKPVLIQADIRQFWDYLTSTNYELGFLINFGKPGWVEIIRRVYDTARENLPRISA
jgi:GxxExxY protein